MLELSEINKIEQRYTKSNREPTLGEAFHALKHRWDSNFRDEDTGLRLAFLAWYSCSEPPFLTGLQDLPSIHDLISEIWEHFGGLQSNSAEFLISFSVFAQIAPWCLGEERVWSELAETLREHAYTLQPNGFTSEQFDDRGAFGDYMGNMVRSKAV